jgi:copper transport protein
VGANKLDLELRDHAGLPLAASAVSVTLWAPQIGIEPRSMAAQGQNSSVWSISEIYLPAAGEWTVSIEAMINDFERRTASGSHLIRR